MLTQSEQFFLIVPLLHSVSDIFLKFEIKTLHTNNSECSPAIALEGRKGGSLNARPRFHCMVVFHI